MTVYPSILILIWAIWAYQPMEFVFFPAKAPPYVPAIFDRANLFCKEARILVVTAHPDDSEFYAAGTLTKLHAAGAHIDQVVCTDGDKGYYIFVDSRANRRTRRAEQKAASSEYGVSSLTFLGFPDGRLRNDAELRAELKTAIQELKPTHILTFDANFPTRIHHQDHSRCAEAVAQVRTELAGTITLLGFSTRGPNFVDDVSDIWPQRLRMLTFHASQFHGERLRGVTNMITESANDAGELIKTEYGESFRVILPKENESPSTLKG